MEPSLETLFLHWRAEGDPDLLARVFDRSAPRLLKVALHLARDPAAAEDLVQATFVQAIESAGDFERDRPLLPWLTGILAHRAGEERRRAGLRGVPRAAPRAAREPGDVVAARELEESVARAIDELPEPCRQVVLLRLRHGLAPAEIAALRDESPGAVRARLHRGLEKLRARLPRGHALPALLAVRPTRGLDAVREAVMASSSGLPATAMTTTWILGGGAMVKKLGAVALVIALVSISLWVSRSGGELGPSENGSPERMALEGVEEPGQAESTTVPAPVAETGERQAMPTPDEAIQDPPAILQGRVQDVQGRPIVDATVFFERRAAVGDGYEPAEEVCSCRTDSLGRFQMPIPRVSGRLMATDELHTAVVPHYFSPTLPEQERVIVVAPRRTYAGTVVDQEDKPREGIPLRIYMDLGTARALRPGAQRSLSRSWLAVSDDRGVFEFTDVGWTEGLILAVRADGFRESFHDLPPHSQIDLEVVLERDVAGSLSVAGVVLDSRGEPAADAYVAFLGRGSARTDAKGRFELGMEEGATYVALQAVKKGYLPARLEPSAPIQYDDLRRLEPIVLVLGGEPLTLAGRVVDGNGRPLSQANVWTRDASPFGEIMVEALSGALQRQPCSVEGLIAGDDRPGSGRKATTDDDGHFEMRGMLARGYRLRAMHPATMEMVIVEGVQGGDHDVRIVLGGAERTRRVAGRVLFHDGRPAVGVKLVCVRDRLPGGEYNYAPFPSHAWQAVDEEGRFVFEALCIEGSHLQLSGGDVPISLRRALEPDMDLENLEIQVPRACRFQVVLERDPEEADYLTVLDESGRRLTLHSVFGRTGTAGGFSGLRGGRSEVVIVGEDARFLVLVKDSAEVRRIPIRLEPGEIQVIRP